MVFFNKFHKKGFVSNDQNAEDIGSVSDFNINKERTERSSDDNEKEAFPKNLLNSSLTDNRSSYTVTTDRSIYPNAVEMTAEEIAVARAQLQRLRAKDAWRKITLHYRKRRSHNGI